MVVLFLPCFHGAIFSKGRQLIEITIVSSLSLISLRDSSFTCAV